MDEIYKVGLVVPINKLNKERVMLNMYIVHNLDFRSCLMINVFVILTLGKILFLNVKLTYFIIS